MALYLVPAANPTALDNLRATIAERVDPGLLTGLRKETVARAQAAEAVGAWGTQPGKNDRNVGIWAGMSPGDRVLFYSQGNFPYAGRVLARERSARVARRLWGDGVEGTWEYMYLLEDVRRIDAPQAAVFARLGYKDGYHLRGFTRVVPLADASTARLDRLIGEIAQVSSGLSEAIAAAADGDDAAIALAIDSVPGRHSKAALEEAVSSHRSSPPPREVEALVARIIRNRKLVEDLKALYGGRCQCCGFTFSKRDGTPYSEAAHIRRISLREADLDVKDNLLVLCPNHHKMLDFGPLEIRYDERRGRLIREEDGKVRRIVNKHVGKDLAGPAGPGSE
jgi:hypothetical protein